MADTPTPETPDTGNSSVGEVGVDPKWQLPFSPNGLPGEFLYGQPANEYGGEGYYDHSRSGGDSTHPFKVDRYKDPADDKFKIRVRRGLLTTHYSKIAPKRWEPHDHGTGTKWPPDGGSGQVCIFTIDGDSGAPVIDTGILPKQFDESSDPTKSYAYLDYDTDMASPAVYLRWIVDWDGGLSIYDEDYVEVVLVDTAVVTPAIIAMGAMGGLGTGDAPAGGDVTENDHHLVRPNSEFYATGGTTYDFVPEPGSDRTLAVYWKKLATLVKTETPTGLLVDQQTHENVDHAATIVPNTAKWQDYGTN